MTPLVLAVVVVALAPPPGDDARKAVVLGKGGEVFAPDASGDYVRTRAFATADAPVIAGRAGGDVVALGDGVVYRLAGNGWSAIRLVQKGKAVMSGGPRSVAAVGRQLFALAAGALAVASAMDDGLSRATAGRSRLLSVTTTVIANHPVAAACPRGVTPPWVRGEAAGACAADGGGGSLASGRIDSAPSGRTRRGSRTPSTRHSTASNPGIADSRIICGRLTAEKASTAAAIRLPPTAPALSSAR